MRDFTCIPRISPCAADHVEWQPRIDQMIVRAANLLEHVSEIEAVDKLVNDGATPEEATTVIRAGAILVAGREVDRGNRNPIT